MALPCGRFDCGRLAALVELENKKVMELIKADHTQVVELVERAVEQSTRQATESFDRLKAKLDQFVAPGASRSDDDGQPPPSRH